MLDKIEKNSMKLTNRNSNIERTFSEINDFYKAGKIPARMMIK
jgi:hypothetical protein